MLRNVVQRPVRRACNRIKYRVLQQASAGREGNRWGKE